MAALAGSSLLAALHSSLERIKTIKRVCRALSKKPQLRTSIEVGYIMAETEKQPLLTREGPGVHRDLCHVARVVSLKEMDSWKLPPQWGQAGAPTCVFVLVLQGRVQLKTKCREAFAARLRAAGGDRSGSAPSNGAEGEGSGFEGASEEELLSLFNSIDTDGSGAIDVSELQTALEMMGIHKSEDEVAELMDGVDDDGSGELEFPEFKAILRKAINGGGAGQDLVWREQPQQPGVWVGDLTAGSAVGEAAILDTSPQLQDGGLMALETTDLLVLERADYERILENGFDGELKAKMTLLRSAPVLGEALRRTDLRRLAYASERRSLGRNVALYEQGAAPAGLELIVEGQCKLVVKVAVTESSSMVGSRRGTDTGIAALGPSGAAAPSSAAGASSAGGAAQAASSAGGTAGQGGSGAAAPSLQQMQQQLLGRVAAADDDVCSSRDSSPSAAAMLRRGSSHLVKAGRSKRLELAVLGPGDMCSEASVLGEERHAHSCVVTSQSLVVLSVSTKDLRKCVHPADMATLREHFERRYSQRSSRLAVAASVAAMSASELARGLYGTTSTAMNSGTGMGAGWGPGDAAMVQAVLAGDADAVGLGGGGGGGMLAAGSSHGQSSSGGVTVTRGGQNELLSYMLGQSVPLDAGEQAYRRINTAPLPAAGHTSSTSVPSNALCTPPGTGTGLSSNATSLTPTPSPLPSAPVSLDGPSLPPPAASQLPPKPPQPHSSSAGGSATPGGVGSATPRAAGSPSPLIRTTSGAAAAAAAAAAALAGPSLGAILSALEAPTVPSRTGGRVRDARTRSEESAGAVTGTGPWPVAGHQRPDYLSASQPIVPGLDQVSQRSPVQLSPRSPLFSSYATAAVNLAAAAAAQSPRGMPTAARPPPPPAVATPAVSKLGYTSQSYHPAWAGGGFGTGGDGGSSASALPSPVSVGVVGAGGAGLAQHCSAAAMDGCGAAVGADLAAQASAASSLPSHAPSAVDVGLPVAVAVNPQGTPAGAAAEEALQYATAAAGVSSWFPTPPPPLTDDEDEAAPQGGGAAGRGLMVIGNPRRGSGGDTELSDGEDGADDEDEWDAPLLALPAGGVAAMVKMAASAHDGGMASQPSGGSLTARMPTSRNADALRSSVDRRLGSGAVGGSSAALYGSGGSAARGVGAMNRR
eukprot:XP_001691041.1 predicted protein [Chlamydomonas reinhardtii]